MRYDLTRDFGKNLSHNFRIALDKVRFLDEDPGNDNSVAIYNIPTSYGSVVYAPGVNDSKEMSINGRWRKLGSVAKSKLPQMATDIVYIDLDNPENRYNKKDRYQDPRYTYRYNPSGRYAGQQKRDGEWTAHGIIPANESRARDKSGYKVPKPEDMITRFYTRFPDRVTQKVESVYQQVKEVQSELVDADFNSPREWSGKYRNAYARFGEAVDEYRQLLNYLDENGRIKGTGSSYMDDYYHSSFSEKLKQVKSDLRDVIKYLSESEK